MFFLCMRGFKPSLLHDTGSTARCAEMHARISLLPGHAYLLKDCQVTQRGRRVGNEPAFRCVCVLVRDGGAGRGRVRMFGVLRCLEHIP